MDGDSLNVEGYQQHRGKRGELRFSTVDFSGGLCVADPAALRTALFSGVVHAKAFGCGLLLICPIDYAVATPCALRPDRSPKCTPSPTKTCSAPRRSC